MIKLLNIQKSFDGKEVIKDLTIEIENGEKVCIMGGSGAGKTTLLDIILALAKPDSGIVTGLDKNISAVFQEDRLCEGFSAVGNIVAVTGKSVPREDIKNLLIELGLSGSEEKNVTELSGGMRRRVAIARALLVKSDIIVMDEPFKGLDDETKKKVINTVLEYIKGKTLIVATHDREDIELLGARLLTI